jgi:outer membrane lipoprotein SlyB
MAYADLENDETVFEIAGVPFVAVSLENNTQFNKYHTPGGLGFAAEDANALSDRLRGRHVEKTGASNTLNGPDRIVDDISIQTKYYDTPQKTLKAFFDEGGKLRYSNQVLEVPSDQYDDIMATLREQIRLGKVKDAQGHTITDPAKAAELIKKGRYTFKQVKNIAKAGNLDSLTFDVKNNLIVSGVVIGVTFGISTAMYLWNGADMPTALQGAFEDSSKTGLFTMTTGVVSSQILRTGLANRSLVIVRSGLKKIAATKLGRSAINRIARTSSEKPKHGAPTINYVAKLVNGTVVVSSVAIVLSTLTDLYRASWEKSISWKQLAKNLAVTTASTGGAVAGAVLGAQVGMVAGSVVPIVGTTLCGVVGGIAGAIAGAWGTGSVTKMAVDCIAADDAEEMFALTQKTILNLAQDYLLSEAEMDDLINSVQQTLTPQFLQQVYASASDDGAREDYVYRHFEERVERIAAQRARLVIIPQW